MNLQGLLLLAVVCCGSVAGELMLFKASLSSAEEAARFADELRLDGREVARQYLTEGDFVAPV